MVCPWCFIGKRRLESALRLFRERFPDEGMPAVRWLPFQLNPDLPEEGVARKDYILRKFGPGGTSHYSHVASVGKAVGIDFAFDDITVQPNTVNAHRLIAYGARFGGEEVVVESLFRAYFQEGADLTDTAVLAAVGEGAGLDRAALDVYLASDADRDSVLVSDSDARNSGVSGVPFFIFNRSIAMSGAEQPETLVQAMMEALKTAAV